MTHKQALSILVQCAGSQRRLACVLDVSEEHISRWVHGRYPVPQWVIAMAEVMDQLPRKDWPERWSSK
jgi:DNA-binding transcriptional regulator YdaS (Cro superfamily)